MGECMKAAVMSLKSQEKENKEWWEHQKENKEKKENGQIDFLVCMCVWARAHLCECVCVCVWRRRTRYGSSKAVVKQSL